MGRKVTDWIPNTIDLSQVDPIRFWSKVSKSDTCWLWTGHNQGKYGVFKLNGKVVKAHRVSWIFANGAIPVGKEICHTCDTPNCVNPVHLFCGTHSDNMQDMFRKNRCKTLKIAYKYYDDIKFLYTTGRYSMKWLGKAYGCTSSHIGRIIKDLTGLSHAS